MKPQVSATKYIGTKDVAKLIRRDLKQSFPDTKFSVRMSRGSAINVFWVDGPSTKDVKRVIEEYEDISYDEVTGAILRGGNRFVFAERDYTPESEKRIKEEIKRKFTPPKDWQEEQFQEDEVWRTLQTTTLPNYPKARLEY